MVVLQVKFVQKQKRYNDKFFLHSYYATFNDLFKTKKPET